MKLSMWIIKDWLEDLVQTAVIKGGRLDIDSIRLYSSNTIYENDILYIGTADRLLPGCGYPSYIVCKNQNDHILLKTTDLISVVNKVQDAYCYYSKWDNDCRNIITQNRTLDDLLDLSTELFPSPIIIVDAAQTFVAVSKQKAEFQESDEWKSAQERGSVMESSLRAFNLAHPDVYNYRHVFAVDPEYFFVKGYCKHIFIDGARRASVILKVPGEDYSTGKLQLFDYYTNIITDWITSCGESGSTFHVRSYFAKALEGDNESLAAMIRQTVLFGWDEKCSKVLFIIAPTRDNFQFDMRMISNMTHEAGGTYAMIHKNKVVILANSDILDHSEFNNALNDFIKSRACYGSVSFAFTEMKLINQAYQLALSALDHNPAIPGALYHSQDTSLRRIAKILNEQASTTLNHPALAVLRDYDLNNKTDFYKTLFCYLKNERHNQNTSDELFIHRNTLFQRLQKIQDIWPMDLNKPEERFLLLFSFYNEMYGEE